MVNAPSTAELVLLPTSVWLPMVRMRSIMLSGRKGIAATPTTHMLGLFEYETNGLNDYTYSSGFITQGAKKYAYMRKEKNKETGEISNKISITVAGVPKSGSKCLKRLEDFKDDLVFDYETTHKQMLMYNDDQPELMLEDYQGHVVKVTEKSGACILPTTYVLGKSNDYVSLLTDASSKRARYKE